MLGGSFTRAGDREEPRIGPLYQSQNVQKVGRGGKEEEAEGMVPHLTGLHVTLRLPIRGSGFAVV